MRELIEIIGLITIGNYKYDSILKWGQSSASFIYIDNKTKEKVVLKLLIAPRNNLEFEKFKNEAETLKEVYSLQPKYQRQGTIPKLKIDLTQHQSFPIYFFAMEYIKGKTPDNFFSENPSRGIGSKRRIFFLDCRHHYFI